MFEKLKKEQVNTGFKIVFFFALLLVAVIFSSYIVIPYSNKYGVSGPLTLLEFNPSNNVIRFLFIVFFPAVTYAVVYFIKKIIFIKINNDLAKEIDIETATNKELHKSEEKLDGNSSNKLNRWALLAIFILFLFFHLGFSTFNNKPLDTFHEGESLGTAVDYQSDKKPYKDTIFLQGIFQNPGRSVVAFNLFGRSISSQRLMESILNIIVFILFFTTIFFLFDLQIVYGVFAGIILFLLLDIGYNIPFRDITTYLFVIVVSLFHSKFVKRTSTNSSLTKGEIPLLCSLSFLCFFIPAASFANSIDRGLYSFAGAIFLFLITTVLLYKKKKILPLFILSATGGFITGLVVVAIAAKGALIELFSFAFIQMPLFKGLLDEFVYEFNGKNLLPIVLFSAIIFWMTDRLLMSVVDKNGRFFDKIKIFIADYYIELFLLFLSLVFFRSALGRSDIGHIAYVSAPLYLTLVYLLVKNGIGSREEGSRLFYSVTIIFLLLLIVSNLFRHDLSKEENWWKFSTNMTDEQLMPESHKKTIEFLKNNLKDDEYFITLTSEATWYYFVNKPCPIKFPIVMFASPKFYQKEAVREIKNKKDKIKYIIYKNNLWTNNFDFIPNEKRLPILFKYIRQNYQFSIMIDDQEIWEIKK